MRYGRCGVFGENNADADSDKEHAGRTLQLIFCVHIRRRDVLYAFDIRNASFRFRVFCYIISLVHTQTHPWVRVEKNGVNLLAIMSVI